MVPIGGPHFLNLPVWHYERIRKLLVKLAYKNQTIMPHVAQGGIGTDYGRLLLYLDCVLDFGSYALVLSPLMQT